MAKTNRKIPTTSQQAKKKGYAKVVVKHSAREKRRWALVKDSGKWNFVKAASASATGAHTVCYYDPNTGFYDDCHTVEG
jgi:hypothetical protein